MRMLLQGLLLPFFSFSYGSYAALCAAAPASQQIPPHAKRMVPLECQVEGGDDENFRYLSAQCWLPPAQRIRGILCVVLHPDGTNGRTLAESAPWQELASAHDCALLGVSIVESTDPTKHWFAADGGSGRALLETIERIAAASGHPELRNAPIALAGVCAAGQFSYEFAAFAPSRTSCFVTIGGAKHDFKSARAATHVPALLVVSPDRGPGATANLEALHRWGGLLGGTWSKAEGAIASYDQGHCQPEVISFLKSHLSTTNEAPAPFLLHSNWPAHVAKGPALRLSFLGKPLPVLARVAAPPLEIKSSPDDPSPKITFRVESGHKPEFDSVSIPSSAAMSVVAEKIGDTDWKIDLRFDTSRIPSGSFQFELPVRLSRNGVPYLGGVQVPLRGTVERDIYPSPRSVRLSSGGASADTSFRLKTRSGTQISGLEIEAIHPPGLYARIESEGSNDPRVVLAGTDASGERPKPIAGYIILRAKSKDMQRVKIPFYGNIAF